MLARPNVPYVIALLEISVNHGQERAPLSVKEQGFVACLAAESV